MAQESPSEADPDDSDAEPQFVEVDPSGRYGRYKEVLGKGAFKKVYRAFDELEGIEVAWNQVKVSEFLGNSMDLDRLYAEVHLLKTLKHKNIIKFYHSWVDSKNEQINFITEIFTSGNLRQYRKKHKNVDLRALKKWSRQILEGLLYLHSHDPPVIHRDLKCDNIFVNGNQGEVKIGDLGLAAILLISRSAHSVLGTPEFMAPEFYKEEYNELVDIYAFGMCLLELVTLEYPYVECTNAAQIYRKVTLGIKPASLEKVKNPEVRAFIEKCIADVTERLSAEELLMDPFLQPDEDSVSRCRSIQPQSSSSGAHLKIDENGSPSHTHRDSHDFVPEAGRDFTVQGQRKDQNIIFLKLRIVDSSGHIRNIHFPFDIEVDTPTNVASEMVEELNLTDHDVSVIAAMIDSEIRSHIPDWAPREQFSRDDGFDSNANTEESGDSQKLDANSPRAPDSPQCSPLLLERMPSGRKYWSDSPKASGGNSPLRHGPSNLMQTDSAGSQDSWSEENSHSPISRKDAYVSSPLRRVDNDSNLDPFQNPETGEPETGEPVGQVDGGEDVSGNDGLEENAIPSDNVADEIKNVVEKLENLLVEANRVENVTEHGPLTIEDDVTDRIKNVVEKLEHLSVGNDTSENVSVSIPLEENTVPSNSASDEITDTVEKLENLLNEQQLELYEIRKKHERAVSDLLKDYSLEVREKVLSLCKLKVDNERRNSTIPYLSRASSITDEATRRSFVERSLFGPVSRFSFKHLKYRVGSDFGIAVILKDDDAEL